MEARKVWFAKLDNSRFEGFRLVELEWSKETNVFCTELQSNGYRMFFEKEEATGWLRSGFLGMINTLQQQMNHLEKVQQND